MLRICEALRDHVKALLLANLRSWQEGHANSGEHHSEEGANKPRAMTASWKLVRQQTAQKRTLARPELSRPDTRSRSPDIVCRST